MVLMQRKLSFSREGARPGGPNANFYRNPYNLWFSWEVRTPYPLPSGSAHGEQPDLELLLAQLW